MSALGQSIQTLGVPLCRRKQSSINDGFQLVAFFDFDQGVQVISSKLLPNSRKNGLRFTVYEKMHGAAAEMTSQAKGSILTYMKLSAVIERDLATGLAVRSVPGIPVAYSQDETIDEVQTNLVKIVELSFRRRFSA